MFKVAIGHSDDVDSIDAISEVINQCRKELGTIQPKAGLLFSAIDYDHEKILRYIKKKLPDLKLIGCTTDGEISSILGFKDDSITLILFASDSIEIGIGIGKDLSKGINKACKTAISQARKELSGNRPKLAIVTPESLTVSGAKVLSGLTRVFGKNFPIFGGTAGDQYRMKQTYQFFKDQVSSDSLPVMLISGPIKFSKGIASGWKPVGKKMKVTKVKDNIIIQIDRKPALEVYTHYFGKGSTIFGEYPIAVFNKKSDKYFYIRSPIHFDQENKTIIYSGDIPPNSYIQFSEGTRDEIINAAKDSVTDALNRFPGSNPETAIIFSCSARKALLGTRTREEINLLKQVIKKDIRVGGFYTYGEISPCNLCPQPSFHNSTFITLLLGEEEKS